MPLLIPASLLVLSDAVSLLVKFKVLPIFQVSGSLIECSTNFILLPYAEGDLRRLFTRYKEEHIRNNIVLVHDLKAVAEKKSITVAQLSIAWVASLGPTMLPLAGSSKASRTLENLAAGDVIFTDEELKIINEAFSRTKITGDRYFGGSDADMHLWN